MHPSHHDAITDTTIAAGPGALQVKLSEIKEQPIAGEGKEHPFVTWKAQLHK